MQQDEALRGSTLPDDLKSEMGLLAAVRKAPPPPRMVRSRPTSVQSAIALGIVLTILLIRAPTPPEPQAGAGGTVSAAHADPVSAASPAVSSGPHALGPSSGVQRASASGGRLGCASDPGGSTPACVGARPGVLPAALPNDNASPVVELGTVVGNASVGGAPQLLAYATGTGYLYVVDSKSKNVTVLNGTTVVATVVVGTSPQGIVYDPRNALVYVSNHGAGSVSVINGTSVDATLTVGTGPLGGIYDPRNGYVYIPNSGSATVSVLNGTKLVANVSVGTSPGPPIYDPANGLVYVPDVGGAAVSVIEGTSVRATVNFTYGESPTSLVYNPTDGFVYAGLNYGGAWGELAYINGTTLNMGAAWFGYPDLLLGCNPIFGYIYAVDPSANQVGVFLSLSLYVTLALGTAPRSPTYDPANGRMYVANSGGNNLSAIAGLQVVGSVRVGSGPFGIAYAPQTGDLLVSLSAAHAVAVVSTVLGIGTARLSPAGDPPASLDRGQSTVVSVPLWGVGSGSLTVVASMVPASSAGCASAASVVSVQFGDRLELGCSPTAVGQYDAWINVTDTARASVWSHLVITVFPDPSVLTPVASAGAVGNIRSADVGEPVRFSGTVIGGTGNFSYVWSGLPVSGCDALTNASPRCTFSLGQVGNRSVVLTVNDTNGWASQSPPLTFRVYPTLQVAPPSAPYPNADVGQTVRFTEAASGGTGTPPAYAWAGLPLGECGFLSSASPTCTFRAPQSLSVRVTVADVNGATATSPTLPFRVYPMPVIDSLRATRSSLDVGQSVSFLTFASGGVGPFTFSWTGLPAGCSAPSSQAPVCTPTASGTLDVRVTALDANGGTSLPSADLQVAVAAALRLGAPIVAPAEVSPGQPVHVSVPVTGGAGANQFNWTGLPDHCTVTAAQAVCIPQRAGTYLIAVDATDANGGQASSNVSALVVKAGPSGPPSGGSGSNGLGGTPMLAYGALAAFVAIVVVVGLLVRRYRTRTGPTTEDEPVGPDEP